MALINDFLSLIYPRLCEACNGHLFKHEEYVCTGCLLNLPKSNFHKFEVNEIAMVFGGRVPIHKTFCFLLFEKNGKVQRLLHAIKYEGQKELAEFLGKQFAEDVMTESKEIDIIIPIPLHQNKLKTRGFNQSEWFSKGLSSVLKIPLDVASLVRVTETSTQTKKRKYERWQNVEGIFQLNNPGSYINKHVLLVDDVVTTGATIEAAWKCFENIKGVKISIACLAYAKRT